MLKLSGQSKTDHFNLESNSSSSAPLAIILMEHMQKEFSIDAPNAPNDALQCKNFLATEIMLM